MSEETKICARCKKNKSTSSFYKLQSAKDGLQYACIECQSSFKKNIYWSNRDVALVKHSESRNKPENKQQRKEYYQKNKDKYKERYLRYMSDPKKKTRKALTGKEYEKRNKDVIKSKKKERNSLPEVKERKREAHKIRKATDLNYVIKRRLRFRLRHVVKAIGDNRVKYKSAVELLGCDLDVFKKHIESQFKDGMDWSALLNGEIHLDHIKPCAKFDLTQKEEQIKCFHYSNIQPLWAEDNLIKKDKYGFDTK